MTLSPTIPYPVSQWVEPPAADATITLVRMYWRYEPTAGVWSLTTDASASAGQLADIDGDGVYTIVPLAIIPFGTATLRATTAGTRTLFY